MILDAFERNRVRSFSDMGACFGVHAGYTFTGIMNFPIDRAYIVDSNPTASALERAKLFPQVEFLRGNFHDPEVVAKASNVDAVIFYDVLLHQVSPDWDEILKMYSTAKCMVIFNQQWAAASRKTVRLHDLGRDEYLRNTPMNFDADGNLLPRIKILFDNFDKMHPQFNKPYKDVHFWWQWGITDKDLINKMESLGYKLTWNKNFGKAYGLPNYENCGFIFSK
jgi:hypothetical protein